MHLQEQKVLGITQVQMPKVFLPVNLKYTPHIQTDAELGRI